MIKRVLLYAQTICAILATICMFIVTYAVWEAAIRQPDALNYHTAYDLCTIRLDQALRRKHR